MIITLYSSSAEPERVDKTTDLAELFQIQGTLRDRCSVTSPTIMINLQPQTITNIRIVDDAGNFVTDDNGNVLIYEQIVTELIKANYAYIQEFDRYYYITDIVSVRNDLWQLSMRVDVLMSFKTNIANLNAVIGRNENVYNALIPDDRIVFNSDVEFTTVAIGGGSFEFDTEFYYLISYNQDYTGLQGHLTAPESLRSFASNCKAIITQSDLNKLIENINNPDFSQAFQNIFANAPLEAFISLLAFPGINLNSVLGYTGMVKSEIHFGSYDTNVKGYIVPYTADQPSRGLLWLGYFNESAGDSADAWTAYTATKYSLWLPFYGFVELDPTEILDRFIHVVYSVDYDDGSAAIYIYATDSADRPTDASQIIKKYDTKVAINISLSSTNAVENARDITLRSIVAGIGLIAAPATGGMSAVIGSGASLVNLANSLVPSYNRGGNSGGPWPALNASLKPYIIKSARQYTEPTNYATYNGRPANYTAQLSTVSGYTEIADVHMEGFDGAYSDEISEIESLLKGGVIL